MRLNSPSILLATSCLGHLAHAAIFPRAAATAKAPAAPTSSLKPIGPNKTNATSESDYQPLDAGNPVIFTLKDYSVNVSYFEEGVTVPQSVASEFLNSTFARTLSNNVSTPTAQPSAYLNRTLPGNAFRNSTDIGKGYTLEVALLGANGHRLTYSTAQAALYAVLAYVDIWDDAFGVPSLSIAVGRDRVPDPVAVGYVALTFPSSGSDVGGGSAGYTNGSSVASTGLTPLKTATPTGGARMPKGGQKRWANPRKY